MELRSKKKNKKFCYVQNLNIAKLKKWLVIGLVLLPGLAYTGWESWTELTDPADGDILAIQDISDTTQDATGSTVHMTLLTLWEDYIKDKVDAEYLNQYGYETIPIAWAADGSSPPDTLDTTTRPPYRYRTFAHDADEDVNIEWHVPSDMSAENTNVYFRVKYLITNATGPTSSEGVAFGLSGVSLGDGDATNYTKGSVTVVQDDELDASQWDLRVTDWSGAVTISGITPGEVAELALIRDVSDAVDDYAQSVGVISIELKFIKTLGGVS